MFLTHKDPDAVDDFSIDWSAWLDQGETLSSVQWIADSGIQILGYTFGPTTASARVSGGRAGRAYTLTCRATTSSGRVNDRSIRILCEEQ